MDDMITIHTRNKLYHTASILALITIFYNVLEGLVSVWFGMADETFALFGFGLDSFVEVISGIGVWHMVRRIRQVGNGNPDVFEQRALKVTGTAFYILAAGLIITGLLNLIQGHKPETTFWALSFLWFRLLPCGS
jgi:divalent metal cation (Fe/Co/Zn/Cd) transporter